MIQDIWSSIRKMFDVFLFTLRWQNITGGASQCSSVANVDDVSLFWAIYPEYSPGRSQKLNFIQDVKFSMLIEIIVALGRLLNIFIKVLLTAHLGSSVELLIRLNFKWLLNPGRKQLGWNKLNVGEAKWWKTLLTDWLILIIIFLIILIIIAIISLWVVYEDSVCSHCELSKYWSPNAAAPSPSCHSSHYKMDNQKCFTNKYFVPRITDPPQL